MHQCVDFSLILVTCTCATICGLTKIYRQEKTQERQRGLVLAGMRMSVIQVSHELMMMHASFVVQDTHCRYNHFWLTIGPFLIRSPATDC